MDLTRGEALRIIQALKAGTPPDINFISAIHVGRTQWLEGCSGF